MTTDYQIKHIYVDNQLIMYKLFFWQKYALAMRINKRDRSIHVYVHKQIPEIQLDSFIKAHISRYANRLQERKSNERIDADLSHLYLLNEKYQLHIVSTKAQRKYEVFGKNIYLQCHKPTDKTFLIKKLLLDYSKHWITPLFQKWLKKMGLSNVQLNFRWMVSRYGVCSTVYPYKVTLGLQSITYRKEVIEYLIVHELVHILHPHHQSEFWNCVQDYLPNWKELDKELLKNGLEYLSLE